MMAYLFCVAVVEMPMIVFGSIYQLLSPDSGQKTRQ
jgi:hypothetical protein